MRTEVTEKNVLVTNQDVTTPVTILNWNPETGILVCIVGNTPYRFKRLCLASCACWRWYSFTHDQTITLHTRRPARTTTACQKRPDFTSQLTSPLGGRILQIYISAGVFVEKDTPLLVIESMKMENEIRAPHDAFIKTLSIQLDDVVEADQLLIVFTKKGPCNGSKGTSDG
jgi:acetyl/propionyl-CoA carboxylase alpha subunit